ncbi:MAG TPA: hypothetical protein VFN30_11420 [Chitinophagaceae bacterium]|nr:hypothetical protein [Chitinophagaceae bacterium]
MKTLFGLIAVLTITNCAGQATKPNQSTAATQIDTSSPNVIFFDDFNDNKNKWTVADNKNASTRVDGGLYYLSALRYAYGEALEVKIDTRKDFEIETRIKILSGNSEHKDYYSMLFWGRKEMNGYYFTFAKDGFISVEVCNGKNQKDCIIKNGSLQKTTLNPDEFNVYTIRKMGRTYSFFVNGEQLYTMPFTAFFGNLMGFGAGRKVTLAIDYLKVIYLQVD